MSDNATGPFLIERQGSFFAGGRVVKAKGDFEPNVQRGDPRADLGVSYHVDHLYAAYQIPPEARSLPLVMVHGFGQSGKTWEETPDGREGYQTIFVRRRFPVYIVDFPRRGKAGYPSFGGALGDLAGEKIVPPETHNMGDERVWLNFRLGPKHGEFFPGVAFSPDAAEQYLQQKIPAVADDVDVIADALAALFDKIGPAVLLTHSQSGPFGWRAAIKSDKVRAIVSYEPSVFFFPEGEVPKPVPVFDGTFRPQRDLGVSKADFAKLARIPIQIVYGDFIPAEPTPPMGIDNWRSALAHAKMFTERLRKDGGDATVLELPKIGITGNTHFPFSDMNNLDVADQLSAYLSARGLDR